MRKLALRACGAEMNLTRPLEGQVKLNSVAAKARYLVKLPLLELHESDDPYIENSSSTFVYRSHASLKYFSLLGVCVPL